VTVTETYAASVIGAFSAVVRQFLRFGSRNDLDFIRIKAGGGGRRELPRRDLDQLLSALEPASNPVDWPELAFDRADRLFAAAMVVPVEPLRSDRERAALLGDKRPAYTLAEWHSCRMGSRERVMN